MRCPAVARASSHPGEPPRCPARMDQKPGHHSGQHGPVPQAGGRGTGNDKHGQQGMRDRALVLVSPAARGKGVCDPGRWRRTQ